MTWRRPASRILFSLGALLVGVAVALVIAARTLPSEGFEDLGRFVGAMLLAGAASIPFALSLLLAQGTWMPRWMVASAAAGCLLALLPAYAFLSVRATGSVLFGALFLAAALGGVFMAVRLWAPRAAA